MTFSDQGKCELGVLAQDLQQVLPEAVSRCSDIAPVDDGSHVDGLLVVNKERLFMENIGATQHLCKLAVCVMCVCVCVCVCV